MQDYVTDAKTQFQTRMRKAFKHELVYDVLKKDMPKFQLDLSSIDGMVHRSLFLLESDSDLVAAAAGLVGVAPVVAVAPVAPGVVALVVEVPRPRGFQRAGGVVPVVLATSLLTPRPSIGKRKARELEYQRQHSSGKKGTGKNTVVEISLPQDEEARRSNALNRLAAAAETKNLLQDKLQQDNRRLQEEQLRLQQEQLCMQVYLQDPTSNESRAFFRAMGERYSQVFAATPAAVPPPCVNTSNNCQQLDNNKKVLVSPISLLVADVVVTPASEDVVVVKLEKATNAKSCPPRRREVYHYDSNDSDDEIIVVKTTAGTTKIMSPSSSTVVVVKVEKKIPIRRQVYRYDVDGSDDDVIVFDPPNRGSLPDTFPDTQRFVSAMRSCMGGYEDSEESTLERDGDDDDRCGWPAPLVVVDFKKLLKGMNDFGPDDESSDKEVDYL
jgi:hypothetical protein